jgi:hypothetical protein
MLQSKCGRNICVIVLDIGENEKITNRNVEETLQGEAEQTRHVSPRLPTRGCSCCHKLRATRAAKPSPKLRSGNSRRHLSPCWSLQIECGSVLLGYSLTQVVPSIWRQRGFSRYRLLCWVAPCASAGRWQLRGPLLPFLIRDADLRPSWCATPYLRLKLASLPWSSLQEHVPASFRDAWESKWTGRLASVNSLVEMRKGTSNTFHKREDVEWWVWLGWPVYYYLLF